MRARILNCRDTDVLRNITVGKWYEATLATAPNDFFIHDDSNMLILCRREGCQYLRGGDWEIDNEDEGRIILNEDYQNDDKNMECDIASAIYHKTFQTKQGFKGKINVVITYFKE